MPEEINSAAGAGLAGVVMNALLSEVHVSDAHHMVYRWC
jgi:hypothetical protein